MQVVYNVRIEPLNLGRFQVYNDRTALRNAEMSCRLYDGARDRRSRLRASYGLGRHPYGQLPKVREALPFHYRPRVRSVAAEVTGYCMGACWNGRSAGRECCVYHSLHKLCASPCEFILPSIRATVMAVSLVSRCITSSARP